MTKKSLVDYTKNLIQQGYDISTIRNFLLKYGYSNNEIDTAINSANKLTIRHEIHLSRATVLVILFVFVSLIGTVSLFYYTTSKTKTPLKLLDLNLEPITTTVEPGESIFFIKELSNLGSAKRYDVIIKQEIIDLKTNKVITQKIETRAIETFGSTQTKILVPQDTKPGNYVLRAIVEYDNKRAVATLPIKVALSAKIETCSDGIKNQNEEGIDCGGTCKPCEEKVTERVIGCNNICEENENCPADCQKPAPFSGFISTETLEEIKELAKINPSKALEQCAQIEVPDLRDTCIGGIGEVQRNKDYCRQIGNARIRDLCYSNVAKSTNDNSLCKEISTDSRKDSCYMSFVLDNQDYSVCDKITNKNMRDSCESLKQLYELNK